MLGVVPRLHLTLQLTTSVSWRWRCVLVCRMALLIPLESPASPWPSEKWCHILQLAREEYRKIPSNVQIVFLGFLNIQLLL